MTAQNKSDRRQRNLEMEQITQYLRKHPRILEQRPELVEILSPPTRKTSSLLDMQQYMIESLQKKARTLRENKDRLITTSQENMKSQERVHNAVLRILDCRTLDEMVNAILEDLPKILDVSLIALYFEKSELLKYGLGTNKLSVLESGRIEHHFVSDTLVTLSDSLEPEETFFLQEKQIICSQALLKISLNNNKPDGMLVLGSTDRNRFNHSQGKHLLSFLSSSLSRCFRLWVNL